VARIAGQIETWAPILRHFGDTRFFPPGLYETRLGQPNQLFHLVAWALSLVVPTDIACKLVLTATILLAPVATARLAAHFERSPWSGVLVSPVMLGWLFRWGLVTNLVGLVVWLFCLPALDRFAKEPTVPRALGVTALTFLVYLGHESLMGLYAVASVVFAILFAIRGSRRLGAFALLACPGGAALLLAARFALRAQSLEAPSMRAIQHATMPFVDRWTSLPVTLLCGGAPGLFLLVALLLAVLGLHARPGIGAPRYASLVDARLPILAAVAFLFYLFMPLTLGGSTLIHQRFLAPAFVLAIVSSVPRREVSLPAWTPALVGVPIAMLALTLPSFADQDRAYVDLDAVLTHMEDRSAVAQLDLDPREPSVVAPIVGAAARALAVHGGRLLFSFTDASYTPVGIVRDAQWNEPVLRLVRTPFAFMPEHDLRRFRYVIVSLTARDLEPAIVASFAPEARLVFEQGKWLLFESTLPLFPLTAPDAELPSPPPETVAARVRRFLGRVAPP
jgi:hypothetical protein